MAGLDDPTQELTGATGQQPEALQGLAAVERSVLRRPALELAPSLLGAVVVHDSPQGRVAIRLTEVEAYEGQSDPGSHAFRGRTPRNAVMFGEPGHLYVYFTYGMHWCANLVCGEVGTASALLMRGGEVVDGLDLARARRPAAKLDRDLARGPARLAQALGFSREHDGADVCAGGRIRLLRGDEPATRSVSSGPRVGVAGPGGDARTYPWRFWSDGDPTVSVYRPAVRRARAPRLQP